MYHRKSLFTLVLVSFLAWIHITGTSCRYDIHAEMKDYTSAQEECEDRNESLADLNVNSNKAVFSVISNCSVDGGDTFWIGGFNVCRYFDATEEVLNRSIKIASNCSEERYFICEENKIRRNGVKCPDENTVSGDFDNNTLIDGQDDSVVTTESVRLDNSSKTDGQDDSVVTTEPVRLDDSSKTETVIAITVAAVLFVLIAGVSVFIFLKRRSVQREAKRKTDERSEHGGEGFNRETPDGTTATLQNNYFELEPQNEAPCNSNYEEPPEEVCDYVSTPDDVYDELRKKRGKIQADTGGPYESLGKDYTYDVTSDIHKRTFPEMITENEYSGFRGDTYDTAGKRTNVQINNSPYDSITVFKET